MSPICAGWHEKELAHPIGKNAIQANLHAFNRDPFMELRNDAIRKLDDPHITIFAGHQIAATPLAKRARETKPRSITHSKKLSPQCPVHHTPDIAHRASTWLTYDGVSRFAGIPLLRATAPGPAL